MAANELTLSTLVFRMRYVIVVLLAVLCCASDTRAQLFARHRQPEWPTTEGALAQRLAYCLANKDTGAYKSLFPPFDTLWSMVLHNPDGTPEAARELADLKDHPQALIEFDPRYNYAIMERFAHVLTKGEDSGLAWRNSVIARYHLVKQEPTRNLLGYQHVAPERFRGFLFMTEPNNRTTFCISVAEIQKVKGKFFGGQVLNVLQANSIEEFHAREQAEQEYFDWMAAHPGFMPADTMKKKDDSTANASDSTGGEDALTLTKEEQEDDGSEDAGLGVRRQVIERKYYEGLFDNEINVRLYVRFLETPPGKPQLYDGLYKLGDNKRYLRLEIKRKPDGKWVLEDEEAVGTMELTLQGRTYTGVWTNGEDNGYDAVLNQTGIAKGKIELLDKILDQGLYGKIDESRFDGKETEDDKKDNDKAGDSDKKKDKGKKGGDNKDDDKKGKKDKKSKKDKSDTKKKKKDKTNTTSTGTSF